LVTRKKLINDLCLLTALCTQNRVYEFGKSVYLQHFYQIHFSSFDQKITVLLI